MAVQKIKDPGKRKAAYYKLQREHAEESGDQATTDKIYSKLGKKSHNVDSTRGDKAILGAAPFIPEALAGLGEMAAARGALGVGKMIPRLGRAAEGGEAGTASKSLVPRRSSTPPEKSYQHLGRATPVKKALPSNKRALGDSGKAPSVGRKSSSKTLSGKQGSKALTSGSQKALPSGDHKAFDNELAAQTKRSKIPGGKKGAIKGSRKKVVAS